MASHELLEKNSVAIDRESNDVEADSGEEEGYHPSSKNRLVAYFLDVCIALIAVWICGQIWDREVGPNPIPSQSRTMGIVGGVGLVGGLVVAVVTGGCAHMAQKPVKSACLLMTHVLMVSCLALVPYVAFFLWNHSSLQVGSHTIRLQPQDVAWMVCGVVTVVTIIASIEAVCGHMRNYSEPDIQKHILRIIMMAPIYAVDCCFSLRYNHSGPVLTVFRELYEAFCLVRRAEIAPGLPTFLRHLSTHAVCASL